MSHVPALAALLVVLITATAASAQDTGDREIGRRIVERWCSDCHGVSAGAKSAATSAPSFSAIAAMPSTTALSLGVFMRTSHPTMPNVMLTPADLNNVIAYVLSLR